MYRTMDGLGLAHATVRTGPLQLGEQGTRKTLAEMSRLVDEGSRDMVVREAVVRAIQSHGVKSHDRFGQATAWFNAVKNGVTFVNDPVRTEWLQSPRVTLNLRAGDCDDRAVLLAAGLAAIGITSQFKVVGLNRRFPDDFSHVYVEAVINGRLVPMDPTYLFNTLGSEPPRPSRTMRWPLWRTA
jgi:transglutaminase-like putative cysteine protease